ncbi:MAG: aminotransferase class I/II-fold pyridoxal phosphate-dependent enzyme [Candidatus Mycalebacterium zealandia]|nr:MAG: aminotransferase class I/II-fold pyridoxal phosphate-dependent enzyme [Candidatus Mycalebacterium zealandia]
MEIKWSDRISELPPYLFAEIDKKKAECIAKGVDVIDLGVGDPDIPTPSHIIGAAAKALKDPANHRYPSYAGMAEFRAAAAGWFEKRFGLKLNPDTEVLALIGSKEGVAHAPMAFVNPGDPALIPDPGYPVYPVSVAFAGGRPHVMPLLKENGFLPDFDAIPSEVASRATMMFLNYPNNPTTAIADGAFFEKVVRFAHDNNIVVCHDAAYTEIAFDGFSPPSFLQTPGAKEVGIEFHSLSKTFSMTGWRIAFAAGSERAIAALGKVKTNIDSGAFQAVQMAGIEALTAEDPGFKDRADTYRLRRDIFCKGLDKAGLPYHKPLSTFYVWFETPPGVTSEQFSSMLLEQCGVVITPGNGFGEFGEGYVRASITFDTERIREAADRLASLSL